MSPSTETLPRHLDRLEHFYGPLFPPPGDAFGLYVWEVLGVHTTPARRDAAMAALRRVPALTPDAMGRAPRAKLESAVALAGPYREERLRALTVGVDAFRRNPSLPAQLRGSLAEAERALAKLPHLSAASGRWMLLFAGEQFVIPSDPRLARVVNRLGVAQPARPRGMSENRDVVSVLSEDTARAILAELGGAISLVQRAALYLAHHGLTTCLESDPLCRICPLRDDCPAASLEA